MAAKAWSSPNPYRETGHCVVSLTVAQAEKFETGSQALADWGNMVTKWEQTPKNAIAKSPKTKKRRPQQGVYVLQKHWVNPPTRASADNRHPQDSEDAR